VKKTRNCDATGVKDGHFTVTRKTIFAAAGDWRRLIIFYH
jgi:hypothetical protein